ncbi:COR domain-containing protein [Flagellimonas meridianipacifica]|uniref:DAPkinase-like Roc (Ras of Complex) protein n=1 Tax=Flagellimonas meridianipacifica TaxID=1080225 RepID=A0A2T0MFN4_9FLAO|nr:COR domain-containing protein [Allomuricauda pacifica]PRX56375.1 DAPkinase-like Roc (Ras of Complex) protein [Allomuricauda pacifica]
MRTISDSKTEVALGEEESTHGINIKSITKSIYFPAKKPFYRRSLDFDMLCFKEFHPSEKKFLYYPYDPDDFLQSEFDYMDDYMELRIIEEPYKTVRNDFYFKKGVKINIWDFGGQEILYSTHQFFLTKRSIYLFVWEPRSDTEEENFDYWLNVIKRLSLNSPVIVVMNKSDVRIKSIDENGYLKKFNNIISFHYVSCLTKEGIDNLIYDIKNAISEIPHMGDKLPSAWDIIRLRLRELDQDYIDLEKFAEICGLDKPENLHFLSEYLTDIGGIIHFNDDISLKNIIILNPHWITKAIYELVQTKKIQENKGLFSVEDLSEHLDQDTYPMSTYLGILSMMEKFEICFKIIGSRNKYIIPSLLTVSPPDRTILEYFRLGDSLKYEIEYTFLIHGIIERLICRLNNNLEGTNFWRYGAVFNDENNRALIHLNKIEKKINLIIKGDTPSQLFSVLSHEIDRIHRDLKLNTDDFDEKIACNCSECSSGSNPYFFSKNVLKRFLTRSKEQIDCPKSTERAEIKEMLIGYKSKKISVPLVRSFVRALSYLQTRHKLVERFNEDEINTFFQDLLSPMLIKDGYITNEQSFKGKSESGNSQGRLDIAIETADKLNVSIYEGFILDSFRKSIVARHIEKTIKHYDPTGLREKFVGVYCKANSFITLHEKFSKYLKTLSTNGIKSISTEDLSHIYVNGSEMKVLRYKYERSSVKLSLFVILVNLNL